MKEYNGHRSWNAWNVALWLYNDGCLYDLVQEEIGLCVRHGKPLGVVVKRIMNSLPKSTPDGARYNALSIRLAIEEDYNEQKARRINE